MTRKATTSVRMGELAVGTGDTVLKSLLGSCIGVALIDHNSGCAGLAHIVLPDSRDHTGPPGKFADTAIPELLRQLHECGAEPERLEAKLAGGASMLSAHSEPIGNRNREAVEEQLAASRIPITGSDCGGDKGRQMTLYPASGRVTIEVVGGQPIEL